MDVSGWISESVRRARTDGYDGVGYATRQVYHKLLQQASRLQSKEYIYERDWDVLIVLDACRYDLFQETVGDRSFHSSISSVGRMASADTMTQHWMRRNFVSRYGEEMARTGYVCGNPFSDRELASNDFGEIDEVWKYAWDDDQGTLPARPITDRAIEMGRTGDYDRMIVHYMQPHCPFIPDPSISTEKSTNSFGDSSKKDVWARLQAGELQKERVWEGYRANLEYVLDDVELLLENLDADRAVITSDHGNALGEWGIYGHPVHMPLSCLRNVPWARVSATDEQTYDPGVSRESETNDDVAERLQSLGYAE